MKGFKALTGLLSDASDQSSKFALYGELILLNGSKSISLSLVRVFHLCMYNMYL